MIPIGATEQHGPNGLIGTDFLIPQAVAAAACERSGHLLGPTLSLGASDHHLGFPGTVSLRPETLQAVLQDLIRSIARWPLPWIYFLNGHGGNDESLEQVRDAWNQEEPAHPTRVHCRSWWTFEEIEALDQKLFGDRNGCHATPSEISQTMFLCPGKVGTAPQGVAADYPDEWPLSPEKYRRLYPDGRIGSAPELASSQAGEQLFQTCVRGVEQDLERIISEGSLLPAS